MTASNEGYRLGRRSSLDACDAVVEKLSPATNPEHGLGERLLQAKQPAFVQAFDVKEFRKRWLALADHREHVRLTKQYGMSELQGLRAVGDTWASQVPIAAIFERLGLLVETRLPCRLESANAGIPRIRAGKLSGMCFESGQLILSGQDWSLAITLSEIDSAWVVTKPASGRLDSAIELYNREGEAITRIYGSSEALEIQVWQDLLGTLPTIG
ncbi:MAG: ChuX/HutX family heme-like substrate-binding protein [Methylococcales bacterium]